MILTIQAMRDAVTNGSYITATFPESKDEVIVDITTANLVVKVYDLLKPENQAKVESMLQDPAKLHRFVQFCWSKVQ